MIRRLSLVWMILGGLVVFAGFAWAGFATGAAQAGADEYSSAPRYPTVPGNSDDEELSDWLTFHQDSTSFALNEEVTADIDMGDPAAGGQTQVNVVIPAPEDIDSGVEPLPETEPPGEGSVPAEVFADMPYVAQAADLTDVVVADPVGSYDIDVCAGEERLPESPAGCPPGFGGTIVPLDGHLPSEPSGDRPPTGYTTFGTDTLTVRTFRRAAIPESVRIVAMELAESVSPESACSPDGDVPESDVIFPSTTIELETSVPGWPWDPDFDVLEVYSLALDVGTTYAVCTYWVDSSGVGLAITFWEGVQVVTPSVRGFEVMLTRYDSYSLNAEQEPIDIVDRALIAAGCEDSDPVLLDWPGTGQRETFDPPKVLCTVDTLTGVLNRGGFPITSQLSFEDLDTPLSTSIGWVSVDRADIFCRIDCAEERLTALPLPDIDHELIDPGGRFAIPPARWRAGRFSILLVFDDPPEGANDWTIGDPVSYDTSDSIVEPPPVLESFNRVVRLNEPIYRVGDSGYATSRAFRLENTTPVSLRVDLLDLETDGPPCVPEGVPLPTYENLTPATSHSVQLDGLCLGRYYALQVTAVDESGVAWDVYDRRSLREDADVYRFDTYNRMGPTLSQPGYTFDLSAELILQPQSGATCFRVGELTLRDSWWGGVASLDSDFSRATPAAIVEWDRVRWYQESVLTRYVGHEATATESSPTMTLTIRGVEARELGNPISLAIATVSRGAGNCSRHPYSGGTLFDLSANPSLTELVAGVEIADGPGSPILRVRALNVARR